MSWKSCQIEYGGILMRSHHEAAWARQFDNDGLEWDYEPVKFSKHYTPDFGLRCKFGQFFVEVKPARGATVNKFHLCTAPLIVVFGRPAALDLAVRYQAPGGCGLAVLSNDGSVSLWDRATWEAEKDLWCATPEMMKLHQDWRAKGLQ